MESTPTTAKKKVAADRHPLAVAFGEYLKAVRKERDKSQAELAFDASMDRTYISLLERGLSAPTLLVLDSLAKSLGLTMTGTLPLTFLGISRLPVMTCCGPSCPRIKAQR